MSVKMRYAAFEPGIHFLPSSRSCVQQGPVKIARLAEPLQRQPIVLQCVELLPSLETVDPHPLDPTNSTLLRPLWIQVYHPASSSMAITTQCLAWSAWSAGASQLPARSRLGKHRGHTARRRRVAEELEAFPVN